MSSKSSTPWMWFSARAVSTSGSGRPCAASAAIATRSAATTTSSMRSGARVVVLDREARRARLGQERDRLRHPARVVRVAALAVDVERERRRARDRRDVRHELVTRDLLVELPERPRVPRAGRRERLEPERREELRRADVPRVRHDEELRALVQLAEAGAAVGGGRAVILRARRYRGAARAIVLRMQAGGTGQLQTSRQPQPLPSSRPPLRRRLTALPLGGEARRQDRPQPAARPASARRREALHLLAGVPDDRQGECWWLVLRDGTPVPGDRGGAVGLLVELRLTRLLGTVLRRFHLSPALDAVDRLVSRYRARLGRFVPDGPAPRRFP